MALIQIPLTPHLTLAETSATGLARLLDKQISHDSVTRFLSAEPKTSAALWRVVKPPVRAVEQGGQYVAVNRLEFPAGATFELWLEEVDFPLLAVKEVFTNEDGSMGVRYLVASDLTLDFDQLTRLYQKRWSREVQHKCLKQYASLEKRPTRTPTTQGNHLFASLCARVKLESLTLKTGVSQFSLKSKIYSSAVKAAYADSVKLNRSLSLRNMSH